MFALAETRFCHAAQLADELRADDGDGPQGSALFYNGADVGDWSSGRRVSSIGSLGNPSGA